MFWKSIQEDIQHVGTCTQQLSVAWQFHSKDMKSPFEAVSKQFLWHSKYPFQQNDLEFRACISRALKKPPVQINKEPHWGLQNEDDAIGYMMCGMHLHRDVHTAGGLSDPVPKGIVDYRQTSENASESSGRVPKTSIKTTFTTKSAKQQGTLSEQQEVDKDSANTDTREHRNNK